jgi:hypothetical protein
MKNEISDIVDNAEIVNAAQNGDPSAIIGRLRSGVALTTDERNWLADRLEGKPGANQRRGPKKNNYPIANWLLRDAFDTLKKADPHLSKDALHQVLVERIYPGDNDSEKAAGRLRKRLQKCEHLPAAIKVIAAGLRSPEGKARLLCDGEIEALRTLFVRN